MKKYIIGSTIVLIVLGFIGFKLSAASPCTLTVTPSMAPLGTTQNITLTLSGTGMSGSFTVPLIVNYTNTYTLTLPYTSGSCSATVLGTSNHQPK